MLLCSFYLFNFVAYILSFENIAASASITDYECADQVVCSSNCESIHEKILKDYSHGWAVRHDSLGRTFHNLGCKVCVEIGVARGELSDYLLKHVRTIEEYHGVDPFLGGYDDAHDAMSVYLSHINATSSDFAAAVMQVLKHHGCRFRLHHAPSTVAARSFPDSSVDCIFIDGDHTFRGVREDIRSWYPKVKPGGFLLFDDYSFNFLGLVHAVDGFVDTNKFDFVKINAHNNYYVQKPVDAQFPVFLDMTDFDQGNYRADPADKPKEN